MPDSRIALASKTLLMVIGPAAIGKSSIMHAASRQDKRLAYVQSFTTRKKRLGETSTYQHLSEDEALRLHAAGETVTFFRHPTTHHIYGTTVESYPTDYNLLDTLSSAVATYRGLSFLRTIAVSITADPDAWEAWLLKRFPTSSTERTARLREAVSSIGWSLAQTTDHYWIENQPGSVAQTAARLVDIIDGKNVSHQSPPQAAALYERAKLLLSYDEKTTL